MLLPSPYPEFGDDVEEIDDIENHFGSHPLVLSKCKE
jgi:hypothetical protein